MNKAPRYAQRSAELSDPLLARTGHAARGILQSLNRLPRDKRSQALTNVLKSFDPQLPWKVRQVANKLQAKGMPTNLAVERALTLALADASIDRIRSIGKARMNGAPPVFAGLGYLGQTTDTTADTPAEADAKKKVGQMFQGIVCSDGVQTAVTDMVGRSKGSDAHQATNLGYEVAQGFAQCTTTTPPPAPPPTPPASSDEGGSMAVPIAIGVGALVVVGGVVWYTRK